MLQELVGRIEELEAVDKLCRPIAGLVGRATAADGVKNALSGTWLGHRLHPSLTDLPIGAWTMAAVLDWTAGRPGAKVARRLVGLGVLAALPAAATGASDWSDTYGAEQRLGVVHGLSAATAALLHSCSYLARRRGQRIKGIAFSTAGLGVTMGAAYLGGHLSFNRGVGVNHTAFEPRVEEWTEVATVSELGADQPARVSAGGVPVVLVQHAGSVYALSANCVHAGGPLDKGEVHDGCIRCPWHSSVFQLLDGKVVRGPAALDQPRWQVRVEDGCVYVRS